MAKRKSRPSSPRPAPSSHNWGDASEHLLVGDGKEETDYHPNAANWLRCYVMRGIAHTVMRVDAASDQPLSGGKSWL